MRNRRRTISSILGVLLAVTFVAGTFIAIDSSARATLDATLAGIPGDFTFYLGVFDTPSFNYTRIEQSLLGSAGVVDASMYRNVDIYQFENPGSPSASPTYATTYGIDPAHLPAIFRNLRVTGSLTLPRGSVAVTNGFATELAVGIGDPVTAVYQQNETIRYQTNLTIDALIEDPTGYPCGPVCIRQPYGYASYVLLPFGDADWLLGQLNQTRTYTTVIGEVWVDRAAYVNPYDIDATTRSLSRIERRLQAILGPTASLSDNILLSIQAFSERIAAQRIQYLLLSMPVVLLGMYLGAIGVDLGHAERRRELAVLKTRGARKSQLVGLLLLEAVVGGLVAAGIGLALGVGLSRFLIGVVNPIYGAPAPYESFLLTTDTILTVALLSMGLMAAVAFRSARRTAALPVIETLRFYVPGETKIQYSPRLDIALVTVGILDYVLVWWRAGSPSTLWSFLLGILPFFLLPFVPLMLIVGLTRLLTRSTGKVYDWFSRAARLFTKDLYDVVRRNLARNPRRSSNIAIIIALGFAFGVFSLSLLATQNAHAEREIRAQIGADMSVTPRFPDRNLSANLTAVPGVAGVTRVYTLNSVSTGFCCGVVVALNPESYFAVTQPEPWYFPDGNPRGAQDVLMAPDRILISESYYANAFLELGDRITLYAPQYDQNGSFVGNVQKNVTVGGVVRFLPGLGVGFNPASIFGSVTTLAPFVAGNPNSSYSTTSSQYLVDIAPDADWRAVKAAVLEDSNVGYAAVVQESIDALNANPFARAFYGFIAMEIIFIVVILTVGVGLILYAASLERDVEFAGMIARGSSGWQTAKLLVGEAFVIMLVGLVIGVAVGLGTAFFAIQFLAAGPPGTAPPAVPYLFVFPADAVLLVLLGPGAMILSAFIVSARTARMNVAQVLKLRGG